MSMERDAKMEIAEQAVKDGLQGGLVSAAASIVTGVGVGTVTTSVPVTVLWGWLTVGSVAVASPIWLPTVIGGCAISGAVAAGAVGGVAAYRRIRAFDAEWAAVCGSDK